MTMWLLSLWLAAAPVFPCPWLDVLPTLTDPQRTAMSLDLSVGFLYIDIDIDDIPPYDLRMVFHIIGASDSLSEEPPWINVQHPAVYYLIDRGHDGVWDEQWIDPKGRGVCEDFRLYRVFGRPA